MMSKGIVYLVGAGPGDPKLLTLRAKELLEQADFVLYDHLVAPQVLEHCRAASQRVYCGKESGKPSWTQEGINAQLVPWLG